jgi:integrase
MVFGLETGMRRSGLSGCRFENIGKHHDYPYIKVPVKGAEGLQTWDVPLSETCMLALENWASWLGHPTHGAIFCQLKRQVTAGHLVHQPDVGLSTNMIYKIIKQRGNEAGVKDLFPHVFRHSFVSWRKLAQVSNEEIASITGHTPDIGWKAMSGYVDMAVVGKSARQTTPPWLAQLVSELIKRD